MSAIDDGSNPLAPDIAVMLEHLEHLFGGTYPQAHYGEIELAWTDPTAGQDGRHALRHALRFGTDQLDELAAEAARLNLTPHCNVYVGAALRRPHFPGDGLVGRASDADFLCLTSAYADLDEPGSTAAAKDKYGTVKPTKIVVTGRVPEPRAQLWWRLDEPIESPIESRALLEGIATALGGDPTVVNPSRVMRLAGSIAWPMKPDRVVEMTHFGFLKQPGQPEYAAAHMRRIFHLAEQPQFHTKRNVAGNGPLNGGFTGPRFEGGLGDFPRNKDAFGHDAEVTDRRELYMRDTIAAVLIEMVGAGGRVPGPDELFAAARPQFERKVDFSRPGHTSEDEFAKKVVYTLKRFREGLIPGAENVEVTQARWQKKQRARADFPSDGKPDFGELAQTPPGPLLLTSAEFVAGFTPPAYLIDGILQRGYLYSLTARTGHGKTAVTMYIAQCIARGQQMHGRTVLAGTVLILAGENPDDVRARFLVMAHQYGFDAGQIKIRWIAGIKHLPTCLPQIRAEADLIEDLVLVMVDTAAAYFPGTETNSNAEQGNYARLLRELTFLRGKPAAIVNCHPVKNAAADNLLPMGGSAFLNEVDGNLTLWATADKKTTLSWQGKFRGPEFNSISFEMLPADSPHVTDAAGRIMKSVVAKPMSDADLVNAEKEATRQEDVLLGVMHRNRDGSFADWATLMNIPRWKVQDLKDSLLKDKLIVKNRRRYQLTDKGREAIGIRVERKGEDFG